MNLKRIRDLKIDQRRVVAVCLMLVLMTTVGCGRAIGTRFNIIRFDDDIQYTRTHDDGFTIIVWKNDRLRFTGFTDTETKQ